MELISVIVPCYNEEESLPLFYDEIKRVSSGMKSKDELSFEFIFVNDGSRDKTLEILRDMAKKDNEVRYVSFSRNFGKEAAMYAGLEVLRPHLPENADAGEKPKAVIGVVEGDTHDIGKNLVKIMMEGCGLEVIDLGVDVSPEQFVATALEQHCDIIACSSLLTTTMNEMRRVVQLAEEKGLRQKVKIMVGGAPITQSFCDEIGADAYTDDAGQAARVAASLLESA